MSIIIDSINSNRSRLTRRQHRCRSGVTLIELVVSAVVLMTVMIFVTSICFRINLVWKDIGHHRVAVNELSNQLEWLTRLPRQKAETAIASLKPSATCARTLREPQLKGKLIEDNLGIRIALQIDWERQNPGKPVELVGWLVSASGASGTGTDPNDSTDNAANEVIAPTRENVPIETSSLAFASRSEARQ